MAADRPTTSGTEPHHFQGLLDALDQLVAPDGYKAGIIRGNIVLSPWPKGYYHRVMELVCKQTEPHLPQGHRISNDPFLYVFPGDERAYGPDIHAAHERTFETTSSHLDGEGLSFVAELTSPSTRDDDVTDKVRVHGRAGIPVHLLLGMQEKQATVFSTPSAKGFEPPATPPAPAA